MKVNITRQDIKFYGLQVAVWLVFLMIPAISAFAVSHSWTDVTTTLSMSAQVTWIPATIYLVNLFFLVPFGYYGKRRWLFWLGNGIILALLVWNYFGGLLPAFMDSIPNEQMKRYAVTSYYSSSILSILMNSLLVCVAVLAHHMYRTQSLKRQLKEEQHKRTEAELEWLKNQLNPHFLFNTLNNISSLVQINADKAQDAIAQLSDLLRYAMYETRREKVPLQGEVEFMRNYVELMKLRCNEKTQVNVQWPVVNSKTTIAPLLFISLIENAFKHGVSSNRDSRIDIALNADEQQLTFVCDNTYYPKDDADRSGSGIGLENTRRRLDLIYPGRYTWEQTLEDDVYHARIELRIAN